MRFREPGKRGRRKERPLTRQDAVARNERLSAIAAGAGLAVAATAFLGWVLDAPALKGFGIDVPIWPLTAIGFACLAGAQLALLRGSRTVALVLCGVPLLIAISGVLKGLAGIDTGIHNLLFREELMRVRAVTPGRPAYMVLADWVLLVGAMLLAHRRTWRACLIACLMANIPLALSIMTIGLTLVGIGIGGLFWASLPASLATILICVSIFFWCRAATSTGVETGNDVAGWTFARALPLVILVPGLTWLLEVVAYTKGAGANSLEVAAVSLNVLLIAAILGWAVHRMSRQQAALRDFVHALDTTTTVLVRGDGTITHWSRGCEQLFGWTAAEAVGRQKQVLLNSRPEAGESEALDLPAGGEIKREATVFARDGRELRVLKQVSRIDRGKSDPVFVVAMTDVTKRAGIEAELRTSQARLEAAIEAHDLAVFDWDPIARTLMWGSRADSCFGMDSRQIEDWQAWKRFVEPADFERLSRSFAAVVAARGPRHRFQYKFNPPGAPSRIIEGSSCCFYDEEGNLTRSIGVQFDVTERERREADLMATSALVRAILDTVPDAMIAVDEHGIIRRFSTGAAETLGYSPEEAIGRHFTLIAAEGRREAFAAAIGRYIETGVAKFIGRVTRTFARRADGAEIPVELRVAETSAGGKRFFILFLRDLSEVVAQEEHLGSLSAELGHVSRLSAMGEMAAGIAHELNQPLTAISNYVAAAARLMQESEGVPQARELVETARQQSLRAGQIIRRMREFASKRQVEIERVSVSDTIRDAVALVFVGPTPLEIKLDYELDPKAETMLADCIQIQQVMVNLLRNSVRAMQQDAGRKEIGISAKPTGNEMIEIGVCDTGPGIPEAVRATLFAPFTTSGEKGGMGIGLSICRRIVEAHGGKIWAENREGGGAVFRFTVPMAIDRESTEA